jgi:putative ABC transport system permease protein
MTTWRIAWRNLWRNTRRTTISLVAIGLSVTLVLIYDGVLRGYGDWILATITGPMIGHVQIHESTWRETRAMERTLRDVPAVLAEIRRDPQVADAVSRIYAPALAALGEEGFAVIALGMDVAAESQPNRLLAGLTTPVPAGQVVMGKRLAEQMGVTPGSVIALVGQAADGSLANDLFTVAALIETPVDFVNRQAVIMTRGDAETLFAMPGEAHEIVVYARRAEDVAALTTRLAGLASLRGSEVLDWKTVAPEMVELLAIVEAAWIFVLLLVFVAAAAGVANTMLMATFERTHEFGMLLALGAAPARLVWMIALESVALGVTGALAGTALGVTLVAWAHHTGVDYARLTGTGPSSISVYGLNWSLLFYPTLALVDVTRVVSAVVITSVLASIWPAARVARLQPATALKA